MECISRGVNERVTLIVKVTHACLEILQPVFHSLPLLRLSSNLAHICILGDNTIFLGRPSIGAEGTISNEQSIVKKYKCRERLHFCLFSKCHADIAVGNGCRPMGSDKLENKKRATKSCKRFVGVN